MNAALLLTALFNGACQGAALCIAAYFAFRMVRRLNATTMFAVWSVLLAICVALPFANYAFAPKTYTVVRMKVEPAAAVPSAHRVRPAFAAAASAVPVRQERAVQWRPAPLPGPTLFERATTLIGVILERASIVLVILAGIALLRLAVLARDLFHMFSARRRVKPIDAPVLLAQPPNRPFKFVSSTEFTSPCVLGFSPALIVIPQELLGGSKDELLSVVLHESEHVRRFDDVQNVIQRFIGAVGFFLPGARIAIRELALYREQICDDAAVNGTGDAVSYAMTLTGMAQWATGRGAPVPSLIFKRKQLVHRLEVLLDSAVSHSLRMNRRFAVSAALVLAISAAIVLRVQLPVVAESIVQPATPKAPRAPKAVPAAPKVVPVAPKAAVAHKPAIAPKAPPKPVIARATPVPAIKAKKPAAPRHAPKPPSDSVPNAPANAPLAPRPELAQAYAAARLGTATAASYGVPVAAYAQVFARSFRHELVPRFAAVTAQAPHASSSSDLLDALDAAGIHNLSVDQLIAIRDHGVSPSLVRTAMKYFGTNFTTKDLTDLADHGVSTTYIDTLTANGITGIAPATVWMLMDHGVQPALIRSANDYFHPAPSPADLVHMTDHGVTPICLDQLRAAGVNGVPVGDVVRLADHGVPASYIVKVRRMNPRATLDDVIRLHDAGI